MYGHIDVARVQGNIHIAPGRSLNKQHRHIHDLSSVESTLVNTSHTIKHLSFGEDIPGRVNPLDGSVEVADHTAMSYQYYIKIVPSMFSNVDGDILYSNQFAVTRNKKRTDDIMSETSLPGIFAAGDVRSGSVKRCAAAVGEGGMAVAGVQVALAASADRG